MGSRDRRQFGRRRTQLHGFIVCVGRAPIPCLVRNISEGGALLEVDRQVRITSYFQLAIEADGFEADCEIRHQTEHGIGVYFREVRVEKGGRDSRYAKKPQVMPSAATIAAAPARPMV